jgi:hypothetical protein
MNPASALPTTEPDATADSVRQWAITTTIDGRTTGYLPPWATENPSEPDVPPEELAARLAGIRHVAEFPGQGLRAVADRLDGVVIPQRNDIRAAWTTQHTSETGARP